jgi:4-amino-4-deoxy-L-arabinose transferase-like glycosyltransferase
MLAKRVWFLLFTIIGAFYLWGLGSLPLVGADEPRYAQVAREMLARRDLITPTLGGLPWFEKPPLLYWMMMASFRVFGVNEYAARLGPAICGLLTAVLVYCLGRSVDVLTRGKGPDVRDHAGADVWNSLGCWSALVWLSSLGAIVFSRGASFDIILTMMVTGALACFFAFEVRMHGERVPGLLASSAAVSEQRRQVLLLCGFYFFIGLSSLAKGLIGPVLIIGVVALYYLVQLEPPVGRVLKSLLWGIPLSLAVAAVWYGPMLAHHGWRFVDQFFVQHHFARFLSNKYHHPAPFYFYVPVILSLAWPWTILFGASLFSARRWHWRGKTAIDRLRIFALLWVALPLIFFSLSESKLIGYILPALPAVALLGGERIACFLNVHRGELVLRLTGAVLIGLAIGGAWYGSHQYHLSALPLGLAAAPLLIVGGAAMVRPRPVRWLFLLIALAVLLTSAVVLKSAVPIFTRKDSVHDLLSAAAARGYATTRVVQLHDVDRTVEFYAAGRISYGADGEPVRFEGVQQVRDAANRNGGVVLCLVPIEYESQLTSYAQVRTEVIGDNARLVLLAVHAK